MSMSSCFPIVQWYPIIKLLPGPVDHHHTKFLSYRILRRLTHVKKWRGHIKITCFIIQLQCYHWIYSTLWSMLKCIKWPPFTFALWLPYPININGDNIGQCMQRLHRCYKISAYLLPRRHFICLVHFQAIYVPLVL